MLSVWYLTGQELVILKPWMRYCPEFVTRYVTEEEWETALKESVTEQEYNMILESRKRRNHV